MSISAVVLHFTSYHIISYASICIFVCNPRLQLRMNIPLQARGEKTLGEAIIVVNDVHKCKESYYDDCIRMMMSSYLVL